MNIGGLNRITSTFDELDDQGMPTSKNNKTSFMAVDKELIEHIEWIQDFLNRRLEG